jgi:DNA repair protein RadC
MSDENPSAVSEAMPAGTLYTIPQRVEHRPHLRRKLETRGPGVLTTTELVAMILGRDAKRAAQELLWRHGLGEIASLTLSELRAARGVGKAGASRLAAVLELHRRLTREKSSQRPRLTRPLEVSREVRDIARLRKEHLVGLYLDAQNFLLHRETVSIGSLNTTRTHPREILYPAIVHNALGFILAHNHPSGGLDPSPEDIEFSRAVHRAGELIGIELFDHIIVAEGGFTSLRERGAL